VAAGVSQFLRDNPDRWDHVIATQDHHIDPGGHFGDPPDYVNTWPAHCVAGTPGADFHPNLDTDRFDAIFIKGEHQAAYSGFEGKAPDGSGLAAWLRGHEVTHVDVCGIATDYCVRATALDAVRNGFDTTLLTSMCAGVAPGTSAEAVDEMRAAGVHIS
ncbi:MAG: isochorismatase family protein, partial [Nocardioides sp.]